MSMLSRRPMVLGRTAFEGSGALSSSEWPGTLLVGRATGQTNSVSIPASVIYLGSFSNVASISVDFDFGGSVSLDMNMIIPFDEPINFGFPAHHADNLSLLIVVVKDINIHVIDIFVVIGLYIILIDIESWMFSFTSMRSVVEYCSWWRWYMEMLTILRAFCRGTLGLQADFFNFQGANGVCSFVLYFVNENMLLNKQSNCVSLRYQTEL